MSRFERAFAKGPALVTFITGGDPTPDATPALLDALVEGGADVIAIGGGFGGFVNGGVKWNNQFTTTFVKGGVTYTW